MTTKSTKTHHYTYIIRHVNGKYYVGRRSTKKDPLLDPYMGSGKWVKGIKDRSTLTKTIIAYYDTVEELKIGEMELIEKYWGDECCMNMLYSSGGNTSESMIGVNNPMFGKTGELCPNYGLTRSDETKKKMSNAKSGQNHPMYGKFSGENNPNFGKIGELSYWYNKKHTEETKKKISDNHADFSGDKHPRFGTTHTEETRNKMSDAKSGEKCYKATITDHIAKMIKIRIAEGAKNKPISEEFNTTVAVVKGIRSGTSWKHITI